MIVSWLRKIAMLISINQLGLIFDIIGVILLFMYGLPSRIIEPPKLLLEGDLSKEDSKKNRFITIMSYIGLSCLFIGFFLQFLGSFPRNQ